MSAHLQQELARLKQAFLGLSARVEERLAQAVCALDARDPVLARRVIAGDREIDREEVDIEEECLQLLALHQPVAGDLRFLITVLKANNDLERIADLAVNIAQRAEQLAVLPPPPAPYDFADLAGRVRAMLREALDALVQADTDRARRVCAADDAIDALHRDVYARIQAGIQTQPAHAPALLHYVPVSRDLERIADHATNIAEDVIYSVEGSIVRHGGGDGALLRQKKTGPAAAADPVEQPPS